MVAAPDTTVKATTPTPPWQARRDPAVWAILAVYLALAISYSYLMELGYGPDETSRHFPYVQWLATQHCLPPSDPGVDCGALELHPPLYYALLLPVYDLAAPYGNRAALRALRWTSPFLVLLALLLWAPVLKRACGGRRGPTLFALALTAWWPDLFADAGALNNDVGAILASAFLLYLVCVRQWESRSLASAALWGGVIGVGALMKSSVLVTCVPVVAVTLVWQHGRGFLRDRAFWLRAATAGAACLALCGWWYWRNLQLYGTLVPVPKGYGLIPPGLGKLDALLSGVALPFMLRAINGLWVSVFAGAVWFPEWSHGTVYGALRLLTAAGVAGVVLGLVRLRRGQLRLSSAQAAATILPAAGFGAMLLSVSWMATFVHAGVYQGGRYLLPFLPGLTIPLALGLLQLTPRRGRLMVAALVTLFLFSLNFLVWYHLVTYWNPFVLSTAGPFR